MSGGIGNQFIQYIVVKHLNLNVEFTLTLDTNSGFAADYEYKRSWTLNELIRIEEKCVKVSLLYMRLLKLISKIKLLSYILGVRTIYSIVDIDKFKTDMQGARLIIVDSNLQEYHDFDSVKADLNSSISVKDSSKKVDVGEWCCLAHFRITDHVSDFDQLQFLEKVITRCGNTWKKLLIHSNNVEETKVILSNSELDLIRNATVEKKTEKIAIAEMSCANVLITGYSTFGWTGGFLNKVGTVICPSNEIEEKNFVWKKNKKLKGWTEI